MPNKPVNNETMTEFLTNKDTGTVLSEENVSEKCEKVNDISLGNFSTNAIIIKVICGVAKIKAIRTMMAIET